MAIVFGIALGLILYTYVLYPALMFVASRWLGRRDETWSATEPRAWPSCSLLLAAHNEGSILAERLEDALSTDYPADRFEVVVGSDGSTDDTAEVARSFAGRGVRLLDFAERRGKAAVLAEVVPSLRGEIVILSDANTAVEPAAVRHLVRHFNRPEVGVVCGRLILIDAVTGRNADGLYWKYETFLKRCEARLGALLGANGAIYAIRKDLFVPIPDGTIIDDFVIPLLCQVHHGCRSVFEPSAVAREETAPDVAAEFRRRTRIGAGGFQALCLLWPLLDPRRGWVALAFLSHKVLRWFGPFFLIAMIITNLAMLDRSAWRWILLAQGGFYAASLAGWLLPRSVRLPRLARLATMFAAMNAALFLGFLRWLTGRQRGTWTPTPRTAEAEVDAEVLR